MREYQPVFRNEDVPSLLYCRIMSRSTFIRTSLLAAVLIVTAVPMAMASGHGHHAGPAQASAHVMMVHETASAPMAGHTGDMDHRETTASATASSGAHDQICLSAGVPVSDRENHEHCLGCCPDSAGASDAVSVQSPGPERAVVVTEQIPVRPDGSTPAREGTIIPDPFPSAFSLVLRL